MPINILQYIVVISDQRSHFTCKSSCPSGSTFKSPYVRPSLSLFPQYLFHGCCNSGGGGGGRGSVLVHSQSVCMRPSSQSSSSSTSAFTNHVRIHHSTLAASARSCSNKIDFPVQQQHCFVFVLVVCLSVRLSIQENWKTIVFSHSFYSIQSVCVWLGGTLSSHRATESSSSNAARAATNRVAVQSRRRRKTSRRRRRRMRWMKSATITLYHTSKHTTSIKSAGTHTHTHTLLHTRNIIRIVFV